MSKSKDNYHPSLPQLLEEHPATPGKLGAPPTQRVVSPGSSDDKSQLSHRRSSLESVASHVTHLRSPTLFKT